MRVLPLSLLLLGVAAFHAESDPPARTTGDDDAIFAAADDGDGEAADDDESEDDDAESGAGASAGTRQKTERTTETQRHGGEGEGVALASKSRTARMKGGCPPGMARVDDFCMDRYEAPNRRGAKPIVMQSAQDAEEYCEAHKKRLCEEDEWIAACEGAQRKPYPYGEAHEEARCNDDKVWRTVDESTLAKWPADEAKAHTKELYQGAPSGTMKGCKSENGLYDLTGNVEEWVVRTREHANDYHHILIGCYWAGCYGGGKPTCRSTNAAHGPGFRFYETGFRCCKDAPKKR